MAVLLRSIPRPNPASPIFATGYIGPHDRDHRSPHDGPPAPGGRVGRHGVGRL